MKHKYVRIKDFPTKARNETIIALRQSGTTYKKLGTMFNISIERTRQIVQRSKRVKHATNTV